ncbi:MAG: hypothetical protein ABIQ01_12365 [Pseudolysinimonas sp.]
MLVLTCPRDGGKLVLLKTKVPGDPEQGPPVTGYWCEAGHKLEEHEKPIDIEEDAIS